MKRVLSYFLLCLAMIALPAQGVAAAVMMVCSAAQSVPSVPLAQMPSVVLPADSPAVESMMLRHAAMKSQAEAALGSHAGAHCHDAADPARQTDGTASLSGMTGMTHPPAHQDHQDHQDHHASHGAGGACSACSACALGAIMPTILPELALASHGHAAPVAALAAYAGFLPAPSDRPPAARC
ncbi:hypothetical protein [Cupriavidus basilensis]|uniref:Uncharacterized protein n=1 Tax=Cupriavidus basilensis TaxID=68895 RepID=A0A0C4YDI7_9BURK|nr:hypothetical protein [Cupriavidus basilensis]AJG23707.1 hypothetical protein RR42_s2125 [Cupriavidus basilensis]